MYWIFLVLLCSVYMNMADPGCMVVTREEWGSNLPTEIIYMIRPVPYVIIEHTDTPKCKTTSECKEILISIQNHHFHLNFSDIGPSFLVGNDGQVYEGRGWLRTGPPVRRYNQRSITISFIGDFSEKLPKKLAQAAAHKLIECGLENGHLKLNYKLLGHRQVSSTKSPGKALYNEIKTWPNWTRNP